MSLHICTTHEKLIEVERLIVKSKQRGEQPKVLIAIADDLRARLDRNATTTLLDIESRIVKVARSKTPFGYDQHKLHELGQGVAARWSVIRQALEMFGAEVEGP